MKRFAALAGATLGLVLAAALIRALERDIAAFEATLSDARHDDLTYPWWEGPPPGSWTA